MPYIQKPSVDELHRIAKELDNDLGMISVSDWRKRAMTTVDGMDLDDAKKVYQILGTKQRKDIGHLEQQAADLVATTKLFQKGKDVSSSNVVQTLPNNDEDRVGAGCAFVVKTWQTAKRSLTKRATSVGNIVEEATEMWKGVKETVTRYSGIARNIGEGVAEKGTATDEE